jgi:hypothetical protein
MHRQIPHENAVLPASLQIIREPNMTKESDKWILNVNISLS